MVNVLIRHLKIHTHFTKLHFSTSCIYFQEFKTTDSFYFQSACKTQNLYTNQTLLNTEKFKMSPFIFFNSLNPTVFVAHTSGESVFTESPSASTPGSGVIAEFQITLNTFKLAMTTVCAVLTYVVKSYNLLAYAE